MDKHIERLQTDIPRQVYVEIIHDAMGIVRRVQQTYMTQLGKNNEITKQATKRLSEFEDVLDALDVPNKNI